MGIRCSQLKMKLIVTLPKQVETFRTASMKGWLYAMTHREELIDLILKKYGQDLQRKKLPFEAQAMSNLLFNDLIEISHMNPERWRRVITGYELSQIENNNILEGFIYNHK